MYSRGPEHQGYLSFWQRSLGNLKNLDGCLCQAARCSLLPLYCGELGGGYAREQSRGGDVGMYLPLLPTPLLLWESFEPMLS